MSSHPSSSLVTGHHHLIFGGFSGLQTSEGLCLAIIDLLDDTNAGEGLTCLTVRGDVFFLRWFLKFDVFTEQKWNGDVLGCF